VNEAGIHLLNSKDKLCFVCYHTCCSCADRSIGRNQEKILTILFNVRLYGYCIYVTEKEKLVLYFIDICAYIDACKLSAKESLFKFNLSCSSTM